MTAQTPAPASALKRTVLFDRHVALGAKMVEFGGWEMPVQYKGIVDEHLATRKSAGLFDVSHMGRFIVRGNALPFLQHVLTNNAAALMVGQAQYTMVPNARGGAVDDAYLYRFRQDEYLLVVNAGNRQKDWAHFQSMLGQFADVELFDRSEELAMISLQGPRSREVLAKLMDPLWRDAGVSPASSPFPGVPSLGQEEQQQQQDAGKMPATHAGGTPASQFETQLPEPRRNMLSVGKVAGIEAMIARTGYTGEPICFEFFVPREQAGTLWDSLIGAGATPVGLGARDTLRLEAALPLYGHELGLDPEGKEIPIYACPLAKFAVSFSPMKEDFIGRQPLSRQEKAFTGFLHGDYSRIAELPRTVRPLAVLGKAVVRAGTKVFNADGKHVGFVTSGTMVPYWKTRGEGLTSTLGEEQSLRPICLALINSDIPDEQLLAVEVRGNRVEAVVVPYHLRGEAPPLARTIVYAPPQPQPQAQGDQDKVRSLLQDAVANTVWRQRQCVNLIPSEMTASPMVRLLSVMDPAFRYAEHKEVKALRDAEVFYYQGTDFIDRVETLLEGEMRKFLGCDSVETRTLSGQMANAVVFSAMMEYVNRAGTKREPRRLAGVMNHNIIKGGHLSSQPMGALKDFVARDPITEMPAVINFPVMADNPYRIDVAACRALVEQYKPELVIFGKSVILHPEPIAEIRAMVTELGLPTVIMFDAAHVLGLLGEHYQQPFREGADIVTGSTHKTFFGTQRGLVGMNVGGNVQHEWLFEAVQRRTFPGATSNHHLGTLLGLLMAAYEMNHFKDGYQRMVIANAKAFAKALKHAGLDVAGDAALGYTQTHQVLLNVGYTRGVEVARKLEASNIIVNYQAGPFEEGFSAAGSIRMGVSEMTRFGMKAPDFERLAELIAQVVLNGKTVGDEVQKLRGNFTEIGYCFSAKEYETQMQQLHSLI
jgi:aminomethyltransferase